MIPFAIPASSAALNQRVEDDTPGWIAGPLGVYQDESEVAIERAAGAHGRHLDVVLAFASRYPIL